MSSFLPQGRFIPPAANKLLTDLSELSPPRPNLIEWINKAKADGLLSEEEFKTLFRVLL